MVSFHRPCSLLVLPLTASAVENSPSLEADSRSISQEMPPPFMEPQGLIPRFNSVSLGTIVSQFNPVHPLTPALQDPF